MSALGRYVEVVNETDLIGRKKENMTRVRTLWQECDRGDEPDLPCQPHMVVESSPGRFHRYLLVADPPLDSFAGVQERLIRQYGSDPNAKDITRGLRLPGTLHLKHHPDQPWLVRLVEGSDDPAWSWEKILQLFPPVTRDRAPRIRAAGSTGAACPAHQEEEVFSRQLLPQYAKVVSALQALDPDIGYLDWLNIGMALHAAGGGDPVALELWDSWSRKGHAYREGETAYRWQTFHFDPAQGVGLGTLFHLCKAAGWKGLSGSDDETIAAAGRQRAWQLEEFDQRYRLVMVEGKASLVYIDLDRNFDAPKVVLSTLRDLKVMYGHLRVPVIAYSKGLPGIQFKPLVDVWYHQPHRKQYDRIEFRPEARLAPGDLRLPEGDTLNLFLGYPIRPVEGKCELILSHIRAIWCHENDEVYQYVVAWLAQMVQFPGVPAETALVLRSGQGAGKNIIIDMFQKIFGAHTYVTTKVDDLAGRFNAHLAATILLVLNEALWGGNRSAAGTVKSVVTDRTLTVEPKGVNKFSVRNCVHLIVLSNEDWPIPVDLDDRRFFILDLSPARIGDHAYFAALKQEIDAGGLEAFLYLLLHWNLQGFDPRKMPDLGLEQVTRLEAKLRGADPVVQWWADVLQDGSLNLAALLSRFGHDPLLGSVRFNTSNWENAPIEVPCATVRLAFEAWAKDRSQRVQSAVSFGRTFIRITGCRRERKTDYGSRQWCYVLPNLAECRAAFEKAIHQAVDWGEPDGEG